MPQCIYCLTLTTGTEPPDHPLPEALGAKEALPPGAVCQKCNDYLKDLDQTLCNHPHLCGMIVTAQLLGKKNRIRTVMTNELQFDAQNQKVRIDLSKCTIEENENQITIQVPDPNVDEWKFSRALHRSGLGMYALKGSVNHALDPLFDRVRAYIRKPANRQPWTFLQRINDQKWGNQSMPRKIAELGSYHFVAIGPAAGFCAFYIHLIVDEFVVVPAGDFDMLKKYPEFIKAFEESARGSGHPISSNPWLLQPGAKPW